MIIYLNIFFIIREYIISKFKCRLESCKKIKSFDLLSIDDLHRLIFLGGKLYIMINHAYWGKITFSKI